MDKKLDYIYFLNENLDILNELENHNTITYDFLKPFIYVLNHIIDNDMKLDGLNEEDVTDLFSSGFYPLYDMINKIKSILEENFNDDLHEMLEFDENIWLLLRVNELFEANEENTEIFSSLIDQLEQSISYRTHLTDEIMNKFEEIITRNNKVEETSSDLFLDICDELGIEL